MVQDDRRDRELGIELDGGARLVDAGEIGRGGTAAIRRVHDRVLEREVAMKVLRRELGRDAAWKERFVGEARITGRLEHPNIVPVHDLGVGDAGELYFTMKLVRGIDLEAWLADASRPPGSSERLSEGLEVFVKVCDALAFAHSRGVLHRDLKPANVMVGEFGQVYVMDWGYARDTSAPAGPARSEPVVGTLSFMAPEQIGGRAEACDERTDVFGLGAILYVILTGVPPYPSGGDLFERFAAVRAAAYTPIQDTPGGPAVPRAIAAIAERALARDPGERYPSVVALQADVQRFLRRGFHLPRLSFPPGSTIVREGDSGDEAYIVVRGTCVASKTVGGERRVLRHMGPGEVFGEMGMLSSLPRSATVEAVSPVTVLVVKKSDLDDEVGLDSWLGTLLRAVVARFRDHDARLHPSD
ncbi:MAG: protein kinase [Myxococcales bacterium]|nr:protein kinase [Myxococcales bacterium]